MRINRCLDMLGEDRIWHRPNTNTPSVGNLVLHLCGNVEQWINATLGGFPDQRDRDAEFETRGPVPIPELKARIDGTLRHATTTITGLNEADLAHTWAVQGYRETGVAILVHVVEHFSYHTGQITLHTKLALDMDTGWYADHDLGAKG